jgi:hypothetical protein
MLAIHGTCADSRLVSIVFLRVSTCGNYTEVSNTTTLEGKVSRYLVLYQDSPLIVQHSVQCPKIRFSILRFRYSWHGLFNNQHINCIWFYTVLNKLNVSL